MGGESRVAWREGLFLRPQHFQQQDRFLDALMRRRCEPLHAYPWGLNEVVINKGLAALGKFAIERCSGILQDGTPFAIPETAPPPPPIALPADCRDAIVYLTLPARQPGAIEFAVREGAKGAVRELVDEEDVHDAFSSERASEAIQVSRPNLAHGVTREQLDGRVVLGLARIVEVLNGKVVFDDRYIPPTLDVRASPLLASFLNDIIGRADQRVDELSVRAVETGAAGGEGIRNLLILQALNRWTPKLIHLRSLPNVHPERLYEVFVELAGELCTFTRSERRPPIFPLYDHERLQLTFEPVIEVLQNAISKVFQPDAGMFNLEPVGPGAFSARIDDHGIFQTCDLYLAVSARKPLEEVRATFGKLVKIGSTLKMRQIVNNQLQAGVTLAATPTPSPYIRVLNGFVYFELDRSSPDYPDLTQAPAIGIHVTGDWPELKLELWWVKRAR